MEHITISELTDKAAPIVPCVSSKGWDIGTPFLDYMQREGWTEAQLIGQDSSRRRSETEILDFLQTWLFFGLLAESCGNQHHRGYFVRPLNKEQREYVICTKNLRAVYRLQKKRMAEASRQEFEYWQEHLVHCLDAAHSVLAKLGIERVPYMSSPVILGIAALCDFVKKAVLTEHAREQCSFLSSETTMFLQEAMAVQGWCPTDVRRLSSDLDVASLFLVSAQPRPDPEKTHSNCCDQKCSAYQVDEKNYRRLHAPNCDESGCADLPVDSVSLHDALSAELVALTRLYESDIGKTGLPIMRAEPGIKYVAISHVWSDGLGNPKANAIFTCQARRIAGYVASLEDSAKTDVPFWIDTLSCPVAPKEDTDRAIALMRETYSDAEKVLVLNSYLLNRKRPALYLEVLALMVSSSWTRRLWTLQEGVLAKELVFQFQDESVELGIAIGLAHLETQQFLEPESMEYTALLNKASQLHDVWGAKDQSISEKLLNCLHSELMWRSTSVPTDEPLCISALIGLPLRDLVAVKIEDRPKQLWKLIRQPPKAVLFWSGSRLKELGFGWAPASLLETPISYFFDAKLPSPIVPDVKDSARQAKVTQNGLVLNNDGLRLGNWTAAISKGFFVETGTGQLLWVTRERNRRARTSLSRLEPSQLQRNPEYPSSTREVSLLLQSPKENLLFTTKPGAVSALIVSHDSQPDQELITGNVEDVCSIFPTYFLTEEQKETVQQTKQQCFAALNETAEDHAVTTIPAPTMEKQPHDQTSRSVLIGTDSDSSWSAEKHSLDGDLSRHIGEGDSRDQLYTAIDAEGLRRIEYDGTYWWIECGLISINQEWCLQ